MVRTYINFCGMANSGKTTTIDMVVKKLGGNPAAKIIDIKKCRKDSMDYMALVEITISKVTYKIALSTYGDSLPALKRSLDFFDKYSPDVMVTASHCHNNADHNKIINNYIEGKRKSMNISKGEVLFYFMLHSQKVDVAKINAKNELYANRLYNQILDSLK